MNGRPDGRARLGPFVVYVLLFLKDGIKYIGYTGFFSKRMREHIRGKSQYTSRKGNFKLVYTEIFRIKSEAKKRELYLKTRTGRRFLDEILD